MRDCRHGGDCDLVCDEDCDKDCDRVTRILTKISTAAVEVFFKGSGTTDL